MFKLYDYDNEFYGIYIDKKNIEIGDKNYFDKLKFIKLDERISSKWIIAFEKNITKNQILSYINLFNEEINKNENITFSEILIKLSSLFDVFQQKDSYKEYLGLLCELSFIYHCKQNNINIIQYYQNNFDKYDFNLPNSRKIEIKKINESDKSILIKHSQLVNLSDDDLIVGVELCFNSHGENLISIIDKLNFNDKQLNFINKILSKIDKNNYFSIDLDKTIFKIIEGKKIPKLDHDYKNIIIDIQYKLFSLSFNKDNKEFFNILKEKMEI